MDDPVPSVRSAAALALGLIGPTALAAVPKLQAMLEDPSGEVREAAAVALGCMGPEAQQAKAALIRAAADPDTRVSRAAREALELISSPFVGNEEAKEDLATRFPVLIKNLRGDNPMERYRSACTLVLLGEEARTVVPDLKKLQDEAKEQLKLHIPTLIEELKSPDPVVRGRSATILGHLGADARAAVPDLLRLLDYWMTHLNSYAKLPKRLL